MAIWERGTSLGLHFDENLIALGRYIRYARGSSLTHVAGEPPAPDTGLRTPDGAHLRFCASRGLVLVTIDSTIRTETIRAAERPLLDQVKVLVFKTENLSLWGQALVLMRAWHLLCDRFEQDNSAWTVALTPSGRLRDT